MCLYKLCTIFTISISSIPRPAPHSKIYAQPLMGNILYTTIFKSHGLPYHCSYLKHYKLSSVNYVQLNLCIHFLRSLAAQVSIILFNCSCRQRWNLSQASQACLCKVFGAWVRIYFAHPLFLSQICLSLCTRSLNNYPC